MGVASWNRPIIDRNSAKRRRGWHSKDIDIILLVPGLETVQYVIQPMRVAPGWPASCNDEDGGLRNCPQEGFG